MKSQDSVFVGMSGGVDSSVSAALLKKAGYAVTGVFIKVWQPDWLTCTWREERRDAMRVAAHLGIPLVTLDLEKEYKKEVVDYMIAEYAAGRTPNPDVMCNRYVKFGGFYEWAMKQGADYVATGHYARIIKGMNGSNELHMAVDANKDQSYFLWTLKEEQLDHILFPVGHLHKPAVRALAQQYGLPTADKKDSQGLCFIGKIDIKDFLKKYIEVKPGNVLDENGTVIGTHEGATLLTIGERHGFTITKKTPDQKPVYIISKDVAHNTITVSVKGSGGRLPNSKIEAMLREINWNQVSVPVGTAVQVRSRYRQELQAATFVDQTTLRFEQPQSTLSPGQSLVAYDGTQCLGGGIIV